MKDALPYTSGRTTVTALFLNEEALGWDGSGFVEFQSEDASGGDVSVADIKLPATENTHTGIYEVEIPGGAVQWVWYDGDMVIGTGNIAAFNAASGGSNGGGSMGGTSVNSVQTTINSANWTDVLTLPGTAFNGDGIITIQTGSQANTLSVRLLAYGADNDSTGFTLVDDVQIKQYIRGGSAYPIPQSSQANLEIGPFRKRYGSIRVQMRKSSASTNPVVTVGAVI